MYQEQTFDLKAVDGLSQKQIEEHLKLYRGYVENVNILTEKIEEYDKDTVANKSALSELRRRLGFEFNGMRLHELYFEALKGPQIDSVAPTLQQRLAEQYGSPDTWWGEFSQMGMMRGVGWVILYHDPKAKRFHNVWVSDHELGHLAGCDVILAMDVWEHAFLPDYLPSQRKDYIDAFFKNLNWNILEQRIISSNF
ncbi:MAG: Fe-Mn family superoxide dismutase [bacterium]|nr:Fe-Mn family superoxide dismutase [bacterium]